MSFTVAFVHLNFSEQQSRPVFTLQSRRFFNRNNNNNINININNNNNDNILLFVRREVAFKYDLMRSNKKYIKLCVKFPNKIKSLV